MTYHDLPTMTPAETRHSAERGNALAKTLKPVADDREFRFPLAVVNVANTQGLGSAIDTAMEYARGPVCKRDAEAWVRSLLKVRKEA